MAAVTGLDPSILADPNYQVQMLRAQRQMALAQALRQQSLTDTPGNGGKVSWTQGLARLAEALSSSMNERQAEKNMKGANQGYAAGLARMFGAAPPAAPQASQAPPDGPPMMQGAPPQTSPPQMAQTPPPQQQMPPPGPPPAPGLGNDPNPVNSGADPLAAMPQGQPAPPQAVPQQPSMPSPSSAGGAPRGPWALTGNPQQDFALYMSNPEEYSKAMIGNAAKGGAPLDVETMVAHARQAMASGDVATASALLGSLEKNNYIAPATARPGGWTQDPHTGQWMFHPQAPIPGAVPGAADANGNMTWQMPQGTEEAVAARSRSQAAGESAGKAPYQFNQTYNAAKGQMEYTPVSQMAGQGGSLNQHYGSQGAPQGGGFAAAPPIGAQAAANTYGQGSAQGALETQNSAEGSQIRVQAYREMQNLLNGGLSTGPTQARMQELAEEHGLSFLAKDNAFVFNKDAALAVAQQAKALGLNSSDARFEAVARATPNMKMTPQALAQVIPVRIGMEYASQAEATANANWVAQHGPQTNPQFKNFWRQNYDPRMFTAYAQGGPQALARAPAAQKQQWLRDYRALKGMGVDFTQFAQ